MQKIVHTMRDKLGLPSSFTLDACRHGGMTELEEAELTDGQAARCQHTRAKAYEGVRQDSNLGMAESKSAALPLGYAPKRCTCFEPRTV